MRVGHVAFCLLTACGFDRSGVAMDDDVAAADAAPAIDPDGASTVVPPDALVCGIDPDDPGPCPTACTGGCQGGVCTIECAGDQACRDDTLECPPGFSCAITCAGQDACRGATVACPPEYGCVVECSTQSACRDTVVQCGAGACAAACGGGDFFGGEVARPTLECGTSCACSPC